MRSTPIAWTHSTFNPWLGCLRVSTACDHCYAVAIAKRTGRRDDQGRDLWDPRAERVRTSLDYWRQPIRWNWEALAAGARHRVFCAIMADIFDNRAPEPWRAELWDLIRATPALEWQLLTKRPQNIAGMLRPDWGDGWPNVWLGTTTKNQIEAARRIPHLVTIPAAIRFLSVEPMLEAIDLSPWLDRLHHVIVGGESGVGNRSRPMYPTGCAPCATRCRRPASRYSLSSSAATGRPGRVYATSRVRIRQSGRPISKFRISRLERDGSSPANGDVPQTGERSAWISGLPSRHYLSGRGANLGRRGLD